MTNTLIISSSFLLPKSPCWNIFKQNNVKLNFSEYADYSKLESSINHEYVFAIIFIEDIMESSNPIYVIDNLTKVFSSFCKDNKSSLIVYPISLYFDNPLKNISEESFHSKLLGYFKNQLDKLKAEFNNLYLIDIDKIFCFHGIENCSDKRNWYEFRMRLSFNGLNLLSQNIMDCIHLFEKPSKKALVLDCDNTLWGGIISEDGISNIKIGTDGVGKAFLDFQSEIINLKSRGILLCIVSKNEKFEVENVLDKHKGMLLKKKDFVEMKINWKNKSINISEIANSLNLGTDSFVFWDDNPIEREEVRINLPEVEVLDIPENIEDWAAFLSNQKIFFKKDISFEDKNKTKFYQQRKKFKKNLKNSKDINTFLKNIDAVPEIIEIDESNISRASQMTLKTNQFNFRTQRFTTSEFERFINIKNNLSFMLKFSDKFGDHGFVGLIMLENINSKSVFAKNYLMSCRILGRHLEIWFLLEVCKFLNNQNKDELKIEFISSPKNAILESFFDNKFFTELFKNKTLVRKNNIYSINIKNFSKKKFDLFG